MKLTATHAEVVKVGDIQEQEFKMKASAISFQILSSGLYGNKILAIIRELCCNAYDAHKSVGKEDVPFEVHLPNSFSPTFIVKDFGTGLTHEQVFDIFTTYFDSSKTESDDFIGQLGLGSKSPFSYTSQYVVESRQNKKVNVYSMFINDRGIPAVSHVGESDTEDDDGLTISFGVNSNDFYRFEEEAREALSYFTPYPNVLGSYHSSNKISYALKTEKWAIRELNHDGNIRVIQGFIKYPVDFRQLSTYTSEDVMLSAKGNILLGSSVDLFVPIGSVQVAPSREHLSYDQTTIKNLILFINEAAEEISQQVPQLVESAKSLWEANIALTNIRSRSSAFGKLISSINGANAKFSYNGSEINGTFDFATVDFDPEAIVRINTVVRKQYGGQRVDSREYNYNQIQHYLNNKSVITRDSGATIFVSDKIHVIHNDANVTRTKIRNYINTNFSREDIVIEFRPTKKEDISKTVDSFIEKSEYDSTKVEKTSDLIASGAIIIAQQLRRARGEKKYYVFSDGMFSRDHADLDEGGVYVPFYRGEWVKNLDDLGYISNKNNVMSFLIKNGIIDEDTQIVGFGKVEIKKYGKSDNWVNANDLIAEYVANNSDIIIESIVANLYCENYSLSNIRSLVTQCKVSDIIKLPKKISHDNAKLHFSRNVCSIIGHSIFTEAEEVSKEMAKSIDETVKDVYNRFPMLRFVRNVEHGDTAIIRDYVIMQHEKELAETEVTKPELSVIF